ncbi:MAG: hypothetical protein V1743_03815, partial [Nanoarchaeota archaeon]
VKVFSKGKTEDKNEDYYGYTKNSFVVVDGSTDKSGRTYQGKTGGWIISRLIVKECLSSKLNGKQLVVHLNKKVRELYVKLGILHDIQDPKNRFSGDFVLARVIHGKVIITCCGDVGYRMNGSTVFKDVKEIDIITSEKRSKYIKKTNDISGSRVYILPFIIKGLEYQNNPVHRLGYGKIDGTHTPEKFIKVFTYPKKEIKTIEIFTDGYFDIPKQATISAWEKMHKIIEKQDPFNYLKYKSTKAGDDRTIMLIHF